MLDQAKSKNMAHYVNAEDLRKEIALSKEKGELTTKAVKMLRAMAEGASKKLKYKYEEDREDCIAFAMMDIVKYWKGYNPEKSKNVFAYYTQMIKNGFGKGWKKLYPNSTLTKVSLDHENLYNL